MAAARLIKTEFTVHIITWNVASALPLMQDVEALFKPQESTSQRDVFKKTDIFVIGLQEAYQSIQDAMASSVPIVGRDDMVELFGSYMAPRGYVRLTFCRILGIVNMVFIRRSLLCYVRDAEVCTTKTGFGGWVGNKGATSIRFTLGDLSLCFTNCHLYPHNENNDRRVQELRDIFEEQAFESPELPRTRLMEHDVMVLFGDLNFRLEGMNFEEVAMMLHQRRLQQLFRADQLALEQIKGDRGISALRFFVEMPIAFPPSYKFEPGTDDYEAEGKKRVPAWCDRILWRMHERQFPRITDTNPKPTITQEYYDIHMQPKNSDHKAVSAGLKILVDISDFDPRVIFHLTEWYVGHPGVISFEVTAGTVVSGRDWVGLYHHNFCSEREHVFTHHMPSRRGKSSKKTQVYSITVDPVKVSLQPGLFTLLYRSVHYRTFIGMSPAFPIKAK